MKYVISESRLDDIVQKFISDYVGDLKSRVSTGPGPTYVWYVGNNERVMFEVTRTNEGERLDVRNDLWNAVKKLFSLSVSEVDDAFLKWMYNYNGYEYPAGVYTIDSLINESRLYDLVQTFISDNVGELKRRVSTSPVNPSIWYVDKNNRVVFEIVVTNKGLRLNVTGHLWNLVKRMFSLSLSEVDDAFLKWMYNYSGTEFPAGVFNIESK